MSDNIFTTRYLLDYIKNITIFVREIPSDLSFDIKNIFVEIISRIKRY